MKRTENTKKQPTTTVDNNPKMKPRFPELAELNGDVLRVTANLVDGHIAEQYLARSADGWIEVGRGPDRT